MVPVVSRVHRTASFAVVFLALAATSAAQTTSPLFPSAGDPAAGSPGSLTPGSATEAVPLPELPVPDSSSPYWPRVQQPPNQPPSQSPPKPSLERQLLRNLWSDQKAIWTWPIHIRGEQARWLVPFAVGTAALIATDRYTAEDAGEFNNNGTHSAVSTDISYIGYIYGVAGVAGSFYLVGRIADNPKARETGLLAAEAAADGTIVSQVLKYIAERPRPGSDSGHGAFFKGGSSFPSAHSTVAWAMAAVVAHEYKGHLWVAITAYGVAALVGAARFASHEHFLSDVLVGSAMGYGIGRHVYNAHHDPDVDSEIAESKRPSRLISATSRIALAPCYNPARRQYGLSASLKF